MSGLSLRERQVLRLIAAGSTNKQIAAALGVQPPTVATHVASLFRKLGVHSRANAVNVAHGRGILPREAAAVET